MSWVKGDDGNVWQLMNINVGGRGIQMTGRVWVTLVGRSTRTTCRLSSSMTTMFTSSFVLTSAVSMATQQLHRLASSSSSGGRLLSWVLSLRRTARSPVNLYCSWYVSFIVCRCFSVSFCRSHCCSISLSLSDYQWAKLDDANEVFVL